MFFRITPILCLATVGAWPAFAGNAPGINNFDKVDAHVYRGGQPGPEGFRYLASIGVKTVIDLREAGERAIAEERLAKELGMSYVNVPMTGLTPPSEAELVKILPILEDASTGAVFVHCMRGADRTGAVIAAYHIDHDRWDNHRALKDAKAHSMSFFQGPRQHFIKNFRGLTVEAKGQRPAGASPATPTPVAATSGQ